MNRLFDDVFRGCFERRLSSSSLSSLNGPWPERLSDSDKEIKVTAEMPGLEEKDIEVLLDDGVLTLKGRSGLRSRTRTSNFPSASMATLSGTSRLGSRSKGALQERCAERRAS
jgi:HSP20 family protein